MIAPTVPLIDGVYRRSFEARLDVPAANRVSVSGRMNDPRFDIEHRWLLSTPEYEVLEAAAQQHRGDESQVASGLCSRYAAIRGGRIGRGFSKRILAELGDDLPGAQAHLLLAIEMARVGQQVYQLPPELDARYPVEFAGPSGAALASWNKDRAYMATLANSCYTYRDASAIVFRERQVVCNFGPEITRPAAGSRNVFWRRKVLSIRNEDGVFVCDSAMEDNLHDIGIRLALAPDGTIRSATSRGERLPYSGLCESPHARVAALAGLRLTKAHAEQFAERIGGAAGCTHLFDLSIDCLRLFGIED